MGWQHVNGIILVAAVLVTILSIVLWWAAWQYDFVGNSDFIGHVSMAAMVLGSAGVAGGALAAWRTDAVESGGNCNCKCRGDT